MISFYGDLITRDIPHEMKRCFFEIYQKMSFNDHSSNDVSSPIYYQNALWCNIDIVYLVIVAFYILAIKALKIVVKIGQIYSRNDKEYFSL